MNVAVVGCGRSGSLVAHALVRSGVARLTLVDPDTLEPHNLGEMDLVRRDDVRRPKVQALADRLRAITLRDTPGLELCAIPYSVLSIGALPALKQADMLVCCVDNPAARLATAFLATLYLKPLLDIGTGIHRIPDRGREPNSQPCRLLL